MKKTIPGCIAAVAVAGGLLLAAPAAASAATDSFGICTPAEASTETIQHPAVGEPTLTVENPDYVPAVPGTPAIPAVGEPTIVIDNPDYVPAVPEIPAKPAVGEPTIVIANPDYIAPTYTPGFWKEIPATYTPAVGSPTIIVTKPNPAYVPAVAEIPEVSHTDYVGKRYVIDVAEQEAVTKTQWRYVKNGGYGEVWLDSNASQKVKIDGHWYERTSKTRTVEVTPAVEEQGHWEEQTFHEYPGDAWTVTSESKHVTQVYVPGTPAQGSETIDVEEANPDYVPAQYTPKTKVWVPPVYTPAVGSKTITVENPDYVPATDAVPGTPAVGEPTLTVENPDYVPEVPEVPEIPAQGEPTITIDNPEYVPASEEVIEHEAVVCPVVVEPVKPLPAAVPVERKAAAAAETETLAQTGSPINGVGFAAVALGLMAAGAGALGLRRKASKQ